MKSLIVRFLVIGLGMTLLTGCAGKRNIPLAENFWQEKQQKIRVASFKAPEPQMHTVGQQGLVDLAINSAMNNQMNKAIKNIDISWYAMLPENFSGQLKKHHMNVTLHPQPIDTSKKSRDAILGQAAGDKLLTLELRAVGARRDYYGFIPTGAPQAYCVLVAEMVDPKDKKVLWRHETEILQPVEGAWDQPPNYPNFTRALQVAVNDAKQELLDSFFSGR